MSVCGASATRNYLKVVGSHKFTITMETTLDGGISGEDNNKEDHWSLLLGKGKRVSRGGGSGGEWEKSEIGKGEVGVGRNTLKLLY